MRQTLNSGIPVGVTADRPHLDRLGNRSEVATSRATADTNSRLGVAVGILIVQLLPRIYKKEINYEIKK